MKLSAWLILVFALSVSASGSGFIPGILQSDAHRMQLGSGASAGLDGSSFAEPADISTESAYAALEYSAENVLRTKTGDRLTADIKTWGSTESLFVPLKITNRPTTIAFSHTSSAASLYYSDDDTGTNLAWKSDSGAWAINHSIGLTRIGIAGSWSTALAPGQSIYPPQVLNIFSGWTPVRFRLDGKQTLLQLARPLACGVEVCVKVGTGSTRLGTDIGEGNSLLSIPAEASSTLRGIDVSKQLNRKLCASVGASRSDGDGSNSIYRNGQPIGKLRYAPGYREMSATLRYQRVPSAVWEMGFTSSRWDLDLHGISINGDKLGLNIKPFSERVDFNGATQLSIDALHLGMERRMSENWSWGWRYKLAKVESDINADYVGRAFFGLISASGSYDNSLLAATVHGLELSARYAHKRTSIEIRLEQVVPQSSGHSSGSGSGSPSAPVERSTSTGGTSLSVISGYAF